MNQTFKPIVGANISTNSIQSDTIQVSPQHFLFSGNEPVRTVATNVRVISCSDGEGRYGCFLVIDRVLVAEFETTVDVEEDDFECPFSDQLMTTLHVLGYDGVSFEELPQGEWLNTRDYGRLDNMSNDPLRHFVKKLNFSQSLSEHEYTELEYLMRQHSPRYRDSRRHELFYDTLKPSASLVDITF